MVGMLSISFGIFLAASAGSSFGGKQILGGDGIFAGKGVRYTNVVSRGTPVTRPTYAHVASYQPVGTIVHSGPVSALDHSPFSGNRAAVSGDIIGPAVQLPASAATHYETGGSLLGESLGLVPPTTTSLMGGRDVNVLTPGRLQYLDLPGFPRFESDGYIVHDQRGRGPNVCPPGGCTGPAEMSPEMQAMYDKYKRYYRNYAGAAAPATAPLVDPVPFSAYNRVPGNSGVHYTTAPLIDHRAGRTVRTGFGPAFAGTAIPGAAIGRTRTGVVDRVQLGGATKGARNSFFGKIYDTPDDIQGHVVDHDDVIEQDVASSMAARYDAGHSSSTARYGAPGKHDSNVNTTVTQPRIPPANETLNDRLQQIRDDVQQALPPRIVQGGILDDIDDVGDGSLLDNLDQLGDSPVLENIRKAVA